METEITSLSLGTLALAFTSGLATSLTPCIYPMLPIVIGYLGNQAGSAARRILCAAAYVLGLSLVYTILGIVAAKAGTMFGEQTATPWVYVPFGLLIFIFGGAMMDWYEIPLPRFLKPKAGHAIRGSLWMALLVGASSGLVAVPCAAPVLGSLLLYISTTGAVVQGGILMFVFALGMNVLLLAVGVSAGLTAKLPRSGRWMVLIKKGLALTLIVSGLYFIFRAGQLS